MMPRANLTQWLLLCCAAVLLLVGQHAVHSQSDPCTSSNTPGILDQTRAWPQNVPVQVNFSTAFTADQFNCMKQVFDNINMQNALAQGNASGVYFEVAHSSTPVASVGSQGAENAPGSATGFK
jgi:hypothetical protein